MTLLTGAIFKPFYYTSRISARRLAERTPHPASIKLWPFPVLSICFAATVLLTTILVLRPQICRPFLPTLPTTRTVRFARVRRNLMGLSRYPTHPIPLSNIGPSHETICGSPKPCGPIWIVRSHHALQRYCAPPLRSKCHTQAAVSVTNSWPRPQ